MSQTSSFLTRRVFLQRSLTGAAGLCLAAGAGGAADAPAKVRKVYVVFKTHLDIGFTDMAATVVEKYHREFIPMALRLARETREKEGAQCFRWTTGSWLIHAHLEQADAAGRKAMEEAILAGDMNWHALPFTTHSEVLDASLFDAGLELSRRLDARFDKQTRSAKMTDVPGHTRGIVPLLQNAGVRLLHIGVNPACMPPEVPPVFRWRAPDGSDVLVMYQKDYGGVLPLPGTEAALALVFTGDNHGPQTRAQVRDAYAQLQRQYPEAELVASDLNEVADALAPVSEALPTVTGELGDSWIHGIGSDPWKIARLRELARLRRDWLRAGTLEAGSDGDLAFSLPLLMVAEHTWGLDVKTHLQAWDCYTPDALHAARATAPFQRIEASWQEKRAYIEAALNALPETPRQEATDRLARLHPVRTDRSAYESVAAVGDIIETPLLSVALDPDTGALRQLRHTVSGRDWASSDHPLAQFAYQTFSQTDYDRFLAQYLTNRPDWALSDLGKPGLAAQHCPSQTWLPRLTGLYRREEAERTLLLAELEVGETVGAPVLGCPPKLTLEYAIAHGHPEMEITLQWFDKAACRLPEALWLSFQPRTAPDGVWLLDKMGQDVDPRDVVRNGGHRMHAVGERLRYADAGGALTLVSNDAPLFVPGARNLLDFNNAAPAPDNGMHCCLCNNVWGTNFVMWFDADMRFRFRVALA